jgi:outer membrane receptor protein involved in Fe transport
LQRFFMKLTTALVTVLFVFGLAHGQQPTPTPGTTPDQIREEVIVNANRIETRIGETPASVVTFSRRQITSSAAPTLDDILRQSAGFSIFRRSSGRNANPTTQGVSLRGVGASGASRSVVLSDGVPLNDPFGGWVQWGRVSPVAVETVEVLRGGASSLYGDAGLSGAINVVPRKVDEKLTFSADVFGGTQRTLSGSAFLGVRASRWAVDTNVSGFHTKGFIPVDTTVRGPVDCFAGTRSANFSARLMREFGKASVFVRPSYFGEVRTNGTGLQTNRTHIRQVVVGGDIRKGVADRFNLKWRAFGGTQVFDQAFSAVNAARTGESLTRVQRVPVQTGGFSVLGSAVLGDQTFLGGIELRAVRGASDEIAVANNVSTALIGAGGRETTTGAFFQDFARIGNKLVLAGSIRYDRRNNYAAFSSTRTLATNQTVTTVFPDRDEDAVSPQVSALYHLSDGVSFYANASRSFRAATLNELYRSFRVGNVLTLANENLRSERANNVEGGIRFARKRFSLRGNAFWTSIDRPVANVTLSAGPSLIIRQRQNAGRTRSRGFEIEAEASLRAIDLSAGYLFSDSTVTAFPSNPALVSRWVPQVARHQVTFQARYARSKWTLAVQGRASGKQFDDDLNLFRLERYAQLDVFLGKRVSENLQIYAAVENIFNSRYSVGKTPVRTVSSPLNIRVGVRWN